MIDASVSIPEIIKLANIYCQARGLPLTHDIYFSQRTQAWATISEDAGQDIQLGETLADAYAWLKDQVGEPR